MQNVHPSYSKTLPCQGKDIQINQRPNGIGKEVRGAEKMREF